MYFTYILSTLEKVDSIQLAKHTFLVDKFLSTKKNRREGDIFLFT